VLNQHKRRAEFGVRRLELVVERVQPPTLREEEGLTGFSAVSNNFSPRGWSIPVWRLHRGIDRNPAWFKMAQDALSRGQAKHAVFFVRGNPTIGPPTRSGFAAGTATTISGASPGETARPQTGV